MQSTTTYAFHLSLPTMATSGLGVPVKLLHESLGHVITVELKTGQLYRGKLAEGACKMHVVLSPVH